MREKKDVRSDIIQTEAFRCVNRDFWEQHNARIVYKRAKVLVLAELRGL